MLILQTKVGERILIGTTWMTVTKTSGQQIFLGFEAPPSIAIVRESVLKKHRRMQQSAEETTESS
jgi:carbon storage regulator CsrA